MTSIRTALTFSVYVGVQALACRASFNPEPTATAYRSIAAMLRGRRRWLRVKQSCVTPEKAELQQLVLACFCRKDYIFRLGFGIIDRMESLCNCGRRDFLRLS